MIGAVALAVMFEKVYYFVGTANKNSFLELRVFEDFSNYPTKTNTYLHAVLGLNHADFTQQKLASVGTLFFLIGVLLVVFAYVIMVLHIVDFIKGKKTDVIGQILSLGFLFISVVFIITDIATNINSARYIGTCPVLFAILIIRYMRSANVFELRFAEEKISCQMVAIVLGVALLLYRFIPLNELHTIPQEQERIVDVLKENHLDCGYANFWDSSVVTVLSKNDVKVRPISISDKINPRYWGSKDSWYEKEAEFVLVRNPEWDSSGVTYENAVARLGEPKRVVEHENYKILIYNYDISEKVEMTQVEE